VTGSLGVCITVVPAFREPNADAVLATDEMFDRFHEGGSEVLVTKGVRRVGLAAILDGKDECKVAYDG